jgi:hypothetical protein
MANPRNSLRAGNVLPWHIVMLLAEAFEMGKKSFNPSLVKPG